MKILKNALLVVVGVGLVVSDVRARPHAQEWRLQAGPVEIEASPPQHRPFLEAVHRAVLLVASGDFDRFEQLFAQRVNGLEPDQLWQGASVVLKKFGQVKKIGFSEMDGDGAFVKVTFEKAQREFFVRLDDEGLLRELTYVPPVDTHNR